MLYWNAGTVKYAVVPRTTSIISASSSVVGLVAFILFCTSGVLVSTTFFVCSGCIVWVVCLFLGILC